MGAGHSHALYVHEHSPVHALPAKVKIVAAVVMAAAAAVTPRTEVWAFAVYALILVSLVKVARVGLRFVATRLLVVLPFLLFAVFIPFLASGEEVRVWGVSLSVDGLWGTWNIAAKALVGATVSILLAATTEIPNIVRGLSVLKVPAFVVSVTSFMIRYLELIADEFGRVRRAMVSRGYAPSWIAQSRPIAAAAGTMFMRSYERGERVHAAMVARGFDGRMPVINEVVVKRADWIWAGAAMGSFVAVSAIALVAS